MFEKVWRNFRKPQGLGGRLLISTMNMGHAPISRWGLEHLDIKSGDRILDIGCGGGGNVARMLRLATEGRVCGLDYSEVCVEKTKRLNRKAVNAGRAEIRLGSVSENPWPDNSFDIVTAFETIYFWPDFAGDLKEVRRVLKPGGIFFICNEMSISDDGEAPYQFWITKLNLNIYTPSDFQRYLTSAGFAEPEIITEGKSRVCVKARAEN
ncbi:MAG: class I SAM-dependent methyltransferase [Treponema sp.]|jgi:ubiquinone/menaquinone biosynthesis C-methylase UbiE|nr:class I SAM-dependent methyltransferase [Treponema sp.]